MRFRRILIAILISFPISILAQSPYNTTTAVRTAFAFEQLSVLTSSTIFTVATYNPTVTNAPSSMTRSDMAMLQCESGPVVFRVDGTAPTTSVGHIINVDDTVLIFGFNNIKQMKLISDTGVTVKCDVTYYRVSSNAI